MLDYLSSNYVMHHSLMLFDALMPEPLPDLGYVNSITIQAPRAPESWNGINPALTVRSTLSSSQSASSSDTSSSSGSDHFPAGKRLTTIRRRLRGTSTETRINMLPDVPDYLVDQFWIVYRRIHAGTQVSSSAYKAFYEPNGEIKTCRLCGHKLQNATQMNQHLEGIHFEFFKYKCEIHECSFSTVRKADLAKHIRDQHCSSNRRYKCGVCNGSLKHEKNLRRHQRLLH